MALVNVTHKPTAARARQFDGSLDSMVDIASARPTDGVSVSFTLTGAGTLASLNISGGTVGSVALDVNDWIVFPDDPDQQAFAVPGDSAGDLWQVV